MNHVHHDLIIEWAKDTNKVIQYLNISNKWENCEIEDVIDDYNGEIRFKFKKREFTKGYWYPCLSVKGVGIYMWCGEGFTLNTLEDGGYYPDYFKKIGKPIGEIKFGDN